MSCGDTNVMLKSVLYKMSVVLLKTQFSYDTFSEMYKQISSNLKHYGF
jgi:hypothetical protein